MGRVYTPEEIMTGYYPATTEAHTVAAEELIAGMHKLESAEPYYFDAMVYGSVALGDHDRRSDVDFLVMLPEKQEAESGLAVAGLVARLRDRHRVHIEPNITTREQAMAGYSHVVSDNLFTNNLLYMANISPYIAGNPAAYLPTSDHRASSLKDQVVTAKTVASQYITHKKTSALRTLSSSDAPSAAMAQRAFEAPSAITRKLQDVTRLLTLERFGVAEPYVARRSRMQLENTAQTIQGGDDGWYEAAKWLALHNREYSELLEDTVSGNTSIETYANWLDGVTPEAVRQMYGLSVAAGRLLTRLRPVEP